MRRKLKKYSLILLVFLLLLPALLRAEDHLQKVQKTITKKIAIGKKMQLNISNQYGDIVIQRWKQKSAMVRVTITGQSTKLSRANALIRFIAIKTSKTPNMINLKTAIDTLSQHINPSSGEQCHISYLVFVPENLKLYLTNRLGNIDVKSFDGDLTIDEKFGDLKIEHTSGPLSIDMEQGNADIDRLTNGSHRFKGFDHIRVRELSGAIDAKFWSGGKVDLGLSGDLKQLSINADNVKPLNITNLKLANAELKIHSTLSKTIYNGNILLSLTLKKPLKTDTIFITGKNDTSQKGREKLLNLKKINVTAMKTQDYELKTGTAANAISVNMSFSVLNLKD